MVKKFRSSPRLQFLSIAVSVAIFSSILGLAAYLTNQTEPLTATFKMRYGENFGIGISSDNYDENAEIIPGSTAAFDPKITNNGNYDVYVFMEVSLPDKSFSLSEIGSDWQLLTTTEDKTVYYYGSSSGLEALPAMEKNDSGTLVSSETGPLCGGVTLNQSTAIKQGDYSIAAIGSAIQTEAADSSSPADVYAMIGGNN